MRISIRVGPFGGTDFSRPAAQSGSGREARPEADDRSGER